MASKSRKSGLVTFISVGLAATGCVIVGLYLWVENAKLRLDERMKQLKSTRASIFYAHYPSFRTGQKYSVSELKAFLIDQGYLETKDADELRPSEYNLKQSKTELVLALHRPAFQAAGHPVEQTRAQMWFEPDGKRWLLKEIRKDGTPEAVPELENQPKKIAAYFAGRVRTQNFVPLSEIPHFMRTAVMAIEDTHFLEHGGISLRSTLRALLKDLMARRWVEGGSTLTQQLMKNLFFSREKAVSRKIKEAIYAFLAESKFSKEDILEAYLNEIYLGQWGTREIMMSRYRALPARLP